jgi:hypothetical protein
MLAWLPGTRVYWIAAWALIPWANAGGNLLLDAETRAVWEQSGAIVVLNYAALSLAVVVTLWGRHGSPDEARACRRKRRMYSKPK